MFTPTIYDEIAYERNRQMRSEKWSRKHDDEHDSGELARAAGCYALYAGGFTEMGSDDGRGHDWSKPQLFPFDAEWWKPKNPRRDLIRAAALIVAEIERLDRLEKKES